MNYCHYQPLSFSTIVIVILGPCDRKYCPYGGECAVEDGAAKCRCIEGCSDVFQPVCGTDNVTYSSECRLKIASCTQHKRIRTKTHGSCGKYIHYITVANSMCVH